MPPWFANWNSAASTDPAGVEPQDTTRCLGNGGGGAQNERGCLMKAPTKFHSLMLGALAPLCAAAFLGLAGSAAAYTPSGVTSNGFETNTAGWSNNDGTITQRASGYVNPGGYASGIAAAEGSHFAGLDR